MLRLARLHLKNIGTYVDETIDFERLKGRVFLVEGPNGAGKSTIFDAIMLALTGQAPRFEDGRGRRKGKGSGGPSDLIRRGEKSGEVILDFVLDGVNYRISRRFKKASSPTLRLVKMDEDWEEVDSSFSPIDRVKELNRWLKEHGITYESILGSMLIPQGRFMDFVASSDAKEKRDALIKNFFKEDMALLESLRQTFKDEKETTKAKWQSVDGALTTTVNTLLADAGLGEHAIQPLAHNVGLETVQGRYVNEMEEVGRMVEEVLDRLRRRISELAEAEKEQRAKVQDLQKRVDHAISLESEFRNLEKTRRELEEALKRKAEMDELASRVEIYRKVTASKVPELFTRLKGVDEQQKDVSGRLASLSKELEEATAALQEARSGAQKLPSLKEKMEAINRRMGSLEEKIAQVREQEGKVRKVRQRIKEEQERRERLAERIQGLQTRKDELERSREEAKKRQEELEKEREELEKERGRLEGAEGRLGQIREKQERHNQLVDARKKAESLEAQIVALEREYEELQKETLPKIAAFLREGLVEGEPCPVCGSTDHPYAHHEEEVDVRGAADKVELILDYQEKVQNLRVELKGAQQEVATLEKLLDGMDGRAISEELRKAEKDVATKRRVSSRLEEIRKEQERIRAELEGLEDESKRVVNEMAQASQDLGGVEAVLKRLEAERTELEAGLHESSRALNKELKKLAAEKEELESRIKELEKALREAEKRHDSLKERVASQERRREELQQAREKLEKELDEALEALGVSLEVAGEYLENTRAWQKRADELSNYRATVAKLEDMVSELEKRLQGVKRIDPEELKKELEKARERLGEIEDEREERANTIERLEKSLQEARKGAEEALGAYMEFMTVDCLASTLDGKGCPLSDGHHIGVSLEQYLLTTVYNDLVEIANQHLGILSKGRYSLHVVPTDGGVDLESYDQFLDQVRPLSTLSGGEKFMVALALAVGLKTISLKYHQAGVDMFFIDEGFGALDEEFRDKAAEMLRSLEARNIGLTIGFVSHQDELKDSVRAAIVITKDPMKGSRVAIRV